MIVPVPQYLVTIDGRDLTSMLAPRLIHLGISEARGEDADTLDIALDDTDGLLAIPNKGAVLDVWIGYAGMALVHKGKFTVDEFEHAGAPDTLTMRARSASLSHGLGERQERSWHKKTIGDIVRTIAGKHKMTPKVSADLEKIAISHIDQTNESDMSFLTRLAKRYDAVMTVKDNNLLFMPIGKGETASGRPLTAMTITRRDGDRHRYHVADRESYSGVSAWYYATKKKTRETVTVGGENSSNLKRLPETYPTQAEARAAATAEWNRVQRGQATFSLTLCNGIPELFPELPVTLEGWKSPISDTAWLLKQVTHTIDGGGGYTCDIELEQRDDPTTDKHRSHFRKGGK